ncbi:MAG: hypothetical protein ACR2OI_00590, partial [Acidimicrobiia bacterium]
RNDESTWVPVESPNGSAWVEARYLTETVDLEFFLEDDRPVDMLRQLATDLRSGKSPLGLVSERGFSVALTNAPKLVSRSVLVDALSERPGTTEGLQLAETVFGPLAAALEAAPDLDSRSSHSQTALIPVELWNFQYLTVRAPDHQPWLVYFEYVNSKPKIVAVGVDA